MKKILVCGIPRSGTTWISSILSYNESVKYIHEPDNERQNLLGLICKDELSRFPGLEADDNCERYKTLFEKTYSGYYLEPYGKVSNVIRDLFSIDFEELEDRIQKNTRYTDYGDPEGRLPVFIREELIRALVLVCSYGSRLKSMIMEGHDTVILKSVHCLLALDFLAERLDIDNILFIHRHPAGIISSHIRMGNRDIWRPILSNGVWNHPRLRDYREEVGRLENSLSQAGARISAIYYLVEQYRQRRNFRSIKYEDICRDKIRQFQELYHEMGLDWRQEIGDYIRELNREGEGYSVQRIAEEQISKWKRELSPSQVRQIKKGYEIFPLQTEYRF